MKAYKWQAVVAVLAVNSVTLAQKRNTKKLDPSNKESDSMIVIMLFVVGELNRKKLSKISVVTIFTVLVLVGK